MSLVETTLGTLTPKAWPELPIDENDSSLPKLTGQQMAWVKAITSGEHNQTTAYLEAYPKAKQWPREWVWCQASKLAANPKVRKWLNAAWEGQSKLVDRSINGHLRRLETAQQRALETADRLEDKDKLNALKVALEAEKQHAQALGLTQEKQTGGVTINLVSFADQEVSASQVTVSQSETNEKSPTIKDITPTNADVSLPECDSAEQNTTHGDNA